MSDRREREASQLSRHRQLLEEFLGDATRDVERMRALLTELEGGAEHAWNRVQTMAHNLSARASHLKLGILAACALELEKLNAEKQAGAPIDNFFMQCVGGAIETLTLEIAALRRV